MTFSALLSFHHRPHDWQRTAVLSVRGSSPELLDVKGLTRHVIGAKSHQTHDHQTLSSFIIEREKVGWDGTEGVRLDLLFQFASLPPPPLVKTKPRRGKNQNWNQNVWSGLTSPFFFPIWLTLTARTKFKYLILAFLCQKVKKERGSNLTQVLSFFVHRRQRRLAVIKCVQSVNKASRVISELLMIERRGRTLAQGKDKERRGKRERRLWAHVSLSSF